MTSTDLNNHLALIEEKCGFGVARELEAHIEALAADRDRLEWLERKCHILGWDKYGEREVVNADDGAEFSGDTFRQAIDAARSAP